MEKILHNRYDVSIHAPAWGATLIYAVQNAFCWFQSTHLREVRLGFHMDDVYQGENLTPVIREFEGIIKDGDFKIADNNLLKTHFLNVALKHNMETRKFRPIKIEQRAHIDGFVSVIDAMTVRQKYWEECGELLKNAA